MRGWTKFATLGGACALVALAIGTIHSLQGTGGDADPPPPIESTVPGGVAAESPDTDLLPGKAVEAGFSTTEELPAETARASRVEGGPPQARPPAFAGRLITETKDPVVGAEITWTPLLESVYDSGLEGQDLDWAMLGALTVETRTDRAGSFAFEVEPGRVDQFDSVIWVTHPDHEALIIVPQPDREQWPIPRTYELSAAPAGVVRVEDIQGRPVEGATVELYGIKAIGGEGQTKAQFDGRQILRRRQVTDASGEVPFLFFPGRSYIRALEGDRLSETFRSEHRSELVLTLHPSFSAKGWVSGPIEGQGYYFPYVLYGTWRYDIQPATRVRSDGDWGPVRIPLVEGDQFHFRLGGNKQANQDVFIDRPSPGETVEVNFDGAPGHADWYSVTDTAGTPILDAEVLVHRVKTSDQGPRRARLAGPGFYVVEGLLEGNYTASVTAPGYGQGYLGNHRVPALGRDAWSIRLSSAGRLQGRCVHRGEAVEDFVILCLSSVNQDRPQIARWSISESKDGSFILEDAPVGDVLVTATARGLGQSEVKRVHIPWGGAGEQVEFEFHDTLVGRGRVVDGTDGEPVPDAQVQLFAGNNDLPVEAIGAPQRVNPDGTFELSGFSRASTVLQVSANGYVTLQRGVSGASDDVIELGDITMSPSQELVIRLVSDEAIDPSRYTLSRFVGTGAPETGFDQDGIMRVTSVAPGHVEAHFNLPDGTWLAAIRLLVAGWPWELEVPVEGSRSLALEIIADPKSVVPAGSAVRLLYHSPNGGEFQRLIYDVPLNEAVAIGGMTDTRVVARLEDPSGAVIGVALGDFDGGSDLELSIVAGAPEYTLRVVNGEGEPLSGVTVDVGTPGMRGGFLIEVTDDEGECRHPLPMDGEELSAHLASTAHGYRVGIPLDPPLDPEQVIELELIAESTLDIQLLDGSEPASGMRCQFVDPTGRGGVWIPSRTSDPEGRVSWDLLTEGEYLLRGHHADYLPVRELVRTGADQPVEVQVRRTGEIVIQATSDTGLPVSGLPIVLTNIEFDRNVMEWVDLKYIVPPPAGLVTDLSGQLRLDGLPHGEYRWRVSSFGGEPLEGAFTVSAGEVVQVPIMVN